MIAWKKNRAEFKTLVRRTKKQEWKEFVEKMHYGTTSSTIFETIQKIKGKPQRKVHILRDNERTYATIPDIAEKLARTFSQISSNENGSHEFMRNKNAIEQRCTNFNSNNTETYNRVLQQKNCSIAFLLQRTPRHASMEYIIR